MKFKTFYSAKESFLLSIEDIQKQIAQEFEEYDFLLIGIHPNYEIKNINSNIKKVFNTDSYVAFHALNVFSDKEIIEGVVAAVFKFEREGGVSVYECDELNEESLKKARKYLNGNRESLHMVIASECGQDFSFFVERLSLELDYHPVDNIIGGISSGKKVDGELRTFQFVNGKIIKNGFVIISFQNVKAKIDISLGFMPYGITYEITGCNKNKIFTVDNDKNFAEILYRILDGIKKPKEEYLWYLPLNIIDDDGYVSTLRTVDRLEKNYVKLFGPVKKHQKFKLSFATKHDLIEEDEKVSKRLSAKIGDVDAVFNFSCVARQYVLGDRQQDELKSYIKNFDTHLFGFFTFGEIGPDKKYKKLKLYNETSLICAMKEK